MDKFQDKYEISKLNREIRNLTKPKVIKKFTHTIENQKNLSYTNFQEIETYINPLKYIQICAHIEKEKNVLERKETSIVFLKT